jgi:hypothetical protein
LKKKRVSLVEKTYEKRNVFLTTTIYAIGANCIFHPDIQKNKPAEKTSMAAKTTYTIMFINLS